MNILVKHVLSVAALVFALGAALASNTTATILYSFSTQLNGQQLCTVTVCYSQGFILCSIGPLPFELPKHYLYPYCEGPAVFGFRIPTH